MSLRHPVSILTLSLFIYTLNWSTLTYSTLMLDPWIAEAGSRMGIFVYVYTSGANLGICRYFENQTRELNYSNLQHPHVGLRRTDFSMNVYTYIHLSIYLCLYMYICTCTCICICIYTFWVSLCICTYILSWSTQFYSTFIKLSVSRRTGSNTNIYIYMYTYFPLVYVYVHTYWIDLLQSTAPYQYCSHGSRRMRFCKKTYVFMFFAEYVYVHAELIYFNLQHRGGCGFARRHMYSYSLLSMYMYKLN